jgi:hypothetical protein
MEESKLAILTDAKNEYTIQLVNILKSSICNGIRYLYDEAKKKCVAENRFNEVLSEFQDYLSQIRLWSQDMIDNEYKRIETESGCDFIKELLVAVFMSQTQILQIISKDHTKKQTQLDIPKPEHFIHKCYINIGREFYKNPMFFYDGPEVSPIERHKNIPQSENVIASTINETIRQLLPVRRILKTYLQESYNIEQDDEEERNTPLEKKPLSKNYQRNLREIVKKEVENYNALKTDTFQQTNEKPIQNPNESSIKLEVKQENESIQVENSLEEDINTIEELPELSMEYIEDAISKQEYISESEDDIEVIKEKENIKKNLIESIDLEEIVTPVQQKIIENKNILSSNPQPLQPQQPRQPQQSLQPQQTLEPVEPLHEPIITSQQFEKKDTQVIHQKASENVVTILEPQQIINENSEIKHVEMTIEEKQSKLKKQKQEEQIITVQRDIPLENQPIKDQIKHNQNVKPQHITDDLALLDPTIEFEEMDLTEGDSLEDLVAHPNMSRDEPIFKPTTAHKFKFFN